MSEKKERFVCTLLPVLAGLLFLILGCLNINGSFWFEESLHADLLGAAPSVVLKTSDSPLYDLLLRPWSAVAGADDVSLRFFSLFAGLVSIVFLFQSLRRLFGLKQAGFAVFSVAVSPLFLRYGQEAGPWMLLVLNFSAGLFFLISALGQYDFSKSLSGPAAAREMKVARVCLAAFAVFSVAGVLTHWSFVLLVLAELYYFTWRSGGLKKVVKSGPLRRAAVFGSILPLICGAAVLVFRGLPDLAKYPEYQFSIKTLADAALQCFCFSDSEFATGLPAVAFIAAAVLLISAFMKTYRAASGRRNFHLLLSIAILPPAFSMIVNGVSGRELIPHRAVLFSFVSLALLAGVVLSGFFRRPERRTDVLDSAAAAAVFAVVAAAGVVNVETRAEGSGVKTALTAAYGISQTDGEPVVAGNTYLYLDAKRYGTDSHDVLLFEKTAGDSRLDAANERADLMPDDFAAGRDVFWFISNSEKSAPEFPDAFKDFRVVNYVESGGVTAFELSRS